MWAPTPARGEDPADQIGGRSRLDGVRDALQGLSVRRIVSAVLHALRPEILQPRKHGIQRSLSRTAWLDGLRGWAALIVCWVHLSVTSHHDLEYCNGYEVSPGVFRQTPAMWPYVRILFSGGQFSVAIFFTISGFVLTRKSIALLHDGRRDDFLETLHSSVFRRPIRLLLPVMSSVLAWCLLWHLFDLTDPEHVKEPTFLAEMYSFFMDMAGFSYIFNGDLTFSKYNLHTWTIPIELRGSMFVFIWLFIVHRIEHRLRIYITIAMMFYLLVLVGNAFYACFFGGMLIAEASLLAAETSAVRLRFPWDAPVRLLKSRPLLYTAALHVLLLGGLWLGSAPGDRNFEHCPVWNPLLSLLPAAYAIAPYRWYWFFWGAGMVVTAAQGIGWLRGFFEWRFSQYLGRISFTLYLIHGHLINIISERLFWVTGVYSQQDWGTIMSAAKFSHLNNWWYDMPWWPFPGTGPYGLEPNFFFCAFVSLPIFVYLAEMCTKLFDTPSVQVANWVYAKAKMMN